jgi:hypothetical protein
MHSGHACSTSCDSKLLRLVTSRVMGEKPFSSLSISEFAPLLAKVPFPTEYDMRT